MLKKSMKILTLAILVVMICSVSSIVLAAGENMYKDVTPSDSTLAGNINRIGGSFLGVAQVVGMVVAVIMLIVLAIKYISAAPNDKAEIKKHAVVYIVGAVVLFGASGLLGIIRSVSEMITAS